MGVGRRFGFRESPKYVAIRTSCLAGARGGRSMSKPLRILVAALASEPGHGGAEWTVMQYVLGLRRLGHEATLANWVEGGYDMVLNTSGILPQESIASIPLRVYLDLDPGF